MRGRCLPYGEGITYWPVVEVVKQLAALPSDPVAAAAIRSLLGESDVGTSGDEIAWAFRKLLEEQAPLVVVFDDIQWGEETFLDLVESTALLSTGAPLLLLCMARPELVERRPGLAGDAAARAAAAGAGGRADRRRTSRTSCASGSRRAAGGNPLFISEMLAMAAGNADVEVPPTLKALLAARLDQLDEAERRVLERGSVEGEIFHRGAVQALAPEETQVTTRLAALVRRELIRPDRAQLAGDDGYRFRHLLIRDAAYDALPKAVRADLHARFADWLDEHGQALVERDEIVGYHLEQAARYQAELGQPDPHARRTRRRAARRRRQARERPPGRPGRARAARPGGRAPAPASGSTSRSSSRPHGRAATSTLARPRRRRTRSPNAPRPRATAPARCSRARWPSSCACSAASLAPIDEQEALCRAALPLEEERADPRRLALLWALLAYAANCRMRNDDERRRLRAGAPLLPPRRRLPFAARGARLVADPRPAPGGRGAADARRARRRPASRSRRPRRGRCCSRCSAASTRRGRSPRHGRITCARSAAAGTPARNTSRLIAMIEGDRRARVPAPRRADRRAPARQRRRRPRRTGCCSRATSATSVASRRRSLCYGRLRPSRPARSSGRSAPAVEALLLAARGELEQAEALARAGVAAAETETDNLWLQGWGYEDLATVLERAGRIDEAREALERALALWERKRCLPYVDRLRDQIDSLGRVEPRA